MNVENSIFANLGQAKIARSRDQYFHDGIYLVVVTDVKLVDSTNPRSKGEKMVFIETDILEVLVDKGTWTNGKGEEVSSNQAGESVSICLKQKWEKFEQYIKAFLCAAGQITPSQAADIDDYKWTEFAEKACFHLGDTSKAFDVSDWTEQPLKGAQLKITATTVKTDKGHDFTRIDYAAVE